MSNPTKNDPRSDRERIIAITSRYFGIDKHARSVYDFESWIGGSKTLKKRVQEFTVVCPDCTNESRSPVYAYVDRHGDDVCPECGLICAGRDMGRHITYETPLTEDSVK
jgi:hypothetical protein